MRRVEKSKKNIKASAKCEKDAKVQWVRVCEVWHEDTKGEVCK